MQSKICACAVSEGYTRCYLVEEISIQYNIWVTVYCSSSDLHEREQNTEKKDVKKSVKLGKERRMSKFKDADNDQYRKR